MSDVTSEKALSMVGNAFILTILLSERAKELRQGAKPLVATDSRNPHDIALQEICEGKISYKLPEGNDE